jgi:type I restriction enzyme S subunit
MSQFVTIGKIAEVNPTIPKTLGDSPNEAVTFLPMASVSEEGRIIASEESLIGTVIKGYRYFEQGDVLLAKITPCMENGKAAFVEDISHKIGFGSTEFHVLRPSSEVDGRYLFYMVWNPIFRQVAKRNMTGTAGQRRVPTDFVKRYKIPLPPLEEQRRIAAILDKADAVRRKRQEAIALTEELLRAAFLEMFGDPITNPKGWEVRRLETAFARNPQIGTTKPAHSDGQQLVVRVGEIGGRNIRLNECGRITLEGKDLEGFLCEPGDLLLARAIGSESHLGKASILQYTAHVVVFDSHVMRLRFLPKLLSPVFFLQWLKTEGGRTRFMREAGRTAVQFNVNAKQISKVEIPLPPIELQEQFVRFYTRTIKFIGNYGSGHEATDNLFNSLLQRAFCGKL